MRNNMSSICTAKIEKQKFYKVGMLADARSSPFSWAVANRAKQEQTIFSELMYRSRNFTVLVSIVNRIGVKPKKSQHSFTTTIEEVLNNFIRHLLITNSNECTSRDNKGQASMAYSSTGRHLVLIK